MALKKQKSYGHGFLIQEVKSYTETIDKGVVDARSVGAVHELQPGLLLGTITATGKLGLYDDDGADNGCRTATHILRDFTDMKCGDPTASSVDRSAVVVELGVVKIAGLGGYDAAAATDLAGKIKFKS